MAEVLVSALDSCKDFDFVQALLNNFLKNHSDFIIEEPELAAMLCDINDKQQQKFSQMEELIQGNLCMTQYFAGINTF